MVALDVKSQAGKVTFPVHVKPRAKKSRIIGVRGGALDVAVAAAPVDGEANAELVAMLAKACGISKSAVSIVSGRALRSKIVKLEGLDESELRRRLLKVESQRG